MEKVLDLAKSIYDICDTDHTAKSILVKLGYTAVSDPKTMGVLKNRTLPMVMPIRGKGLADVIKVFEDEGYTVTGLEDTEDEDD